MLGKGKKGGQREEEGEEGNTGERRERMGKQCKGRRAEGSEMAVERWAYFLWHIAVSKLSQNMTH